ncbi:hypothetical protein WJX81_004927 [Elliptochloris bilobata]|uniref:Calmodulin n=1 Tax=Elliptochloris bilobata TaxID=381761 RepID=A0AAW1S8C8_9CHLO
MQSTTVAVGGKGANPDTTLYVGGLEESVNEAILHSAFIPFGDIKDVNIPMDHATGKHRGFGFVEFESKEDAADAIDNMHNSELYGRVLRTNYAQPMKIKGGDKGFSHQAVWADADDWYEKAEAEGELEKLEEAERQKALAAESAKLQGEAHAGLGGKRDARVAALALVPQRLTIAGVEYQPRPAGIARFGGVAALLLGAGLLLAPVATLGTMFHASDGSLAGALVEVCVYGYVLLQGAGQLADGSELLLEVVEPGIIGGVVLPVLGALPDTLIVAVSGLGGGPPEEVQHELAVGIGTLAGSTVALLTLAWGGALLLGRCDLGEDGRAVPRTLTRGGDLLATGVTADADVRSGAAAMIASLALYAIVQVPAALGDAAEPQAALIGGVACLSACLGNCGYQVAFPELQRRKIAAAHRKRQRMHAVREFALRAEPFGRLLAADGSVDRDTARGIFATFDRDGDGCIDPGELRALLVGLELPSEAGPGGAGRDGDNLGFWMRELDADRSSGIDVDEFHAALSRWVREKRKEANRGSGARRFWRRGMQPAVAAAADPHAFLLEAAPLASPPLASGVPGAGAAEDEDDADEDGEADASDSALVLRAAAKLLAGVALCAVFSDPLVGALGRLSDATGVPPFFVGFVLTPLASNASELVSSLRFAARKRPRAISLTLSQIYGAVTMNNTLCLGVFLLVIHLAGLPWVYSSEVAVILGATALVGSVGLTHDTFRAAWALPALALYPLSLGAVWWLDTFLGWQ